MVWDQMHAYLVIYRILYNKWSKLHVHVSKNYILSKGSEFCYFAHRSSIARPPSSPRRRCPYSPPAARSDWPQSGRTPPCRESPPANVSATRTNTRRCTMQYLPSRLQWEIITHSIVLFTGQSRLQDAWSQHNATLNRDFIPRTPHQKSATRNASSAISEWVVRALVARRRGDGRQVATRYLGLLLLALLLSLHLVLFPVDFALVLQLFLLLLLVHRLPVPLFLLELADTPQNNRFRSTVSSGICEPPPPPSPWYGGPDHGSPYRNPTRRVIGHSKAVVPQSQVGSIVNQIRLHTPSEWQQHRMT